MNQRLEHDHTQKSGPPLTSSDQIHMLSQCIVELSQCSAARSRCGACAWLTGCGGTGLGEMMPTQLWDTTLDPTKRMLKRLTVEEAAEANIMFSLLMGDKVRHPRATSPHAVLGAFE